MKKLVALMLVGIISAFALVGCGSKECDLCGSTEGVEEYEILGEKLALCEDCMGL